MSVEDDMLRNMSQTGITTNNAGYAFAGAIQIRLDTKSLVDEFDMYIRGVQTRMVQDADGRIINKTIWKGKPILNEIGYQSVMQWINAVINNQSVQGNFIDEEQYQNFLCRSRMDLATDLMINRERYGLDVKDYGGLISKLMRMVEVFMTRPIFNKERDSYANTIKSVESLQTNKTSGGFSFPFMGGKK